MFCCNCGKKLPDSAKFCWSCGTPTIGEQERELQSAPAPQPQPTLISKPEPQSNVPTSCSEPQRSHQFAQVPTPHPEQRRYVEKPKRSGSKWMVVLFIAIIAVVGGVIAYLWFEGGGVTNIYGTPRKTVDRMLSCWAKDDYIGTRACLSDAMSRDFDSDDFYDFDIYSYNIERVEQSGNSATVWVDLSTNDGWYEDYRVPLIKDGDSWKVTDI